MTTVRNGVVYDDRGRPNSRVNPRTGQPGMPLRGDESPIAASNAAPNLTLEQIATNLFQQTDPLRRELIDRSESFLDGGANPMKTPEYAAIRGYANTQAAQAKENILDTLPSGGVLLDKLADVDIGRARTLTDAASGIYGDNLTRAMSLASGGMEGALQARSAADQLTAAREAADASRDAAAKGGVGTGVGLALGGK